MRKLILSLFAGLCAICASAADNDEMRTINGAVIDITGNPLPGALIETKDGITTTADADGSFSLQVPKKTKWLRTSYPGVGIKLSKLKNRNEPTGYSLIEVKKTKTHYWFFNFAVGAAFNHGSFTDSEYNDYEYSGTSYATLGLSLGYLNNWGGYLSFMSNNEDGVCVSAGVTKRLWTSWTYRSNLYVYGGVGYDSMEYEDDDWDDEVTSGVLVEAGLIYRHRHFVTKIGYGHSFGVVHTGCSSDRISLSIGYCI